MNLKQIPSNNNLKHVIKKKQNWKTIESKAQDCLFPFSFKKGENVLILDENEKGLARGLSSFTSSEINKIKGKQSKEIENVLGYLSKSEIVHKDDMVKL